MGVPVKVKLVCYCPMCGTPAPRVIVNPGQVAHYQCDGCKADFEVGDFTKRMKGRSRKERRDAKPTTEISFDRATRGYERYVENRTVKDLSVLSFGEWVLDRRYEIIGRIG